MSQVITYNGNPYVVPDVGDLNWGASLTSYLVALSTGNLTRAGGLFTLMSDVDFGISKGVKSLYFSSRSVNPATAGVLRLANGEAIEWRNALNTANLPLLVNNLNQLTFNGVQLQSALTPGSITEATSAILTILNGAAATVGPNVTIQVQKSDATHDGYLSQTDWSTFNGKQNALSFGNLTDLGTDGITITGGTGAVIGAGATLSQHVADVGNNGYLSAVDWANFNSKLPGQAFVDIQRVGFLNQTETSISFNDATYTFTLTDAGAGWSYYRAGVKYTISGNKTVQIGNPPATGQYFIVINNTTGALSSSTTPWTLLDSNIVTVATVYWNSANTPKYLLSEERHAVVWDSRIHYYEHRLNGTEALAVGVLTGPTIGSDVNANKTFGFADSLIADEDLNIPIAQLTQPNGITNDYLVIYRTAVTTWTWVTTNQPFRYSGTYIYYDNAGTQTVASGGDFVNSYLCFGNVQGAYRFFIIQGQAAFNTSPQAVAESPAAFGFIDFPLIEYTVVYQFTWRCLAGNTSSGKCQLNVAPKRISVNAVQSSGVAPSTQHNSLAGLQGGTSGEYYHLTAAGYTIATQAATDLLNGYLSSTDHTALTNVIASNALKAPLASPALTGTATAASLDVQTFFKGKGTATNDSAAAGYIGEYIESVVGSGNVGAASQYFDVTSITLSAGDWDVTGIIYYNRNGATYSSAAMEIGISTNSGNSSAGLVSGSNNALWLGVDNLWTRITLYIPAYRVSLATNTTIYLKGFPGAYTIATPFRLGRISARRVR